jgi:hypothetical protein
MAVKIPENTKAKKKSSGPNEDLGLTILIIFLSGLYFLFVVF